jgi:hypothetical protein
MNRAYPFLLAALFPILLLWLNANWAFQGLGHMDAWFYFGYFSHYPHYNLLSQTYQGERLAWILPGRLLTLLLGSPYGAVALQSLSISISLLAFHGTATRWIGARSAIVASLLLAAHPCFIGMNGWSYPSGGSLAWMLLSQFCALRASESRRCWVWLVASGMAWAAMVCTYLAWVILTPAWLVFFFAARIGPRKILAFVSGAVAATGLMQLLHSAVFGGRGFFLAQNLKHAIEIQELKHNPFVRQDWAWIWQGSWMVFPVLALAVSVIALVRPGSGRTLRLTAGLYMAMLAPMAFMTAQSSRLLSVDYQAGMLLPASILVLGATVLRVREDLDPAQFTFAAAAACAIPLTGLWYPGSHNVFRIYGMLHPYLLGVAAIGAWLYRRNGWTMRVLLMAMATLPLAPPYTRRAYEFAYNGPGIYRRISAATAKIHRYYQIHSPRTYVSFWIDNYGGEQVEEYRAIMCAFSAHNISMQRFPSLDPGKRFAPGTHIVLLTRTKEVLPLAGKRMAGAGMPVELTGQEQVEGAYWISYLRTGGGD